MEGDEDLRLRFVFGVLLLRGLLEEEDDDAEAFSASVLDAAVDGRG